MDQAEIEAAMLDTNNVVPPAHNIKKHATTTKVAEEASTKNANNQRKPKAS